MRFAKPIEDNILTLTKLKTETENTSRKPMHAQYTTINELQLKQTSDVMVVKDVKDGCRISFIQNLLHSVLDH